MPLARAPSIATVLLDYLRFQAAQQPKPAAATINRRVGVVECALRNAFPCGFRGMAISVPN